MQENLIYLVLGCHGRCEGDFTLCPGVHNKILLLDEDLEKIDDLWKYLDGVGLIDRPVIDINAIRNILYRMQDKFDQKFKKLWSEMEFNQIERFIHMHKACGLIVRLQTSCVEKRTEHIDNVIRIKSTQIKSSEPITNHTRRR